MRKLFLLTTALVFLFSGFLITISSFASDKTWKIGTIFPLTGPLAKNGINNFTGVKIATQMINDNGGVLGKKIKLVSADAPEPQAAASEANRLITNENVKAIIGTGGSSLCMAASVVAEKNKVFYIENEGVSGLITARKYKYLFRTTFSGSMMANLMLDYTENVLAPKMGKDPKKLRIAIIHENGGFGISTGKGLAAYAKTLGLKVVLTEKYNAKTADLSGLILKLKVVRPDISLAAQYVNDAILFHRQANELKLMVPVLGTTAGQGTHDFGKALGPDADKVLAGGIPAELSIEKLTGEPLKIARELIARYEKDHNGKYPSPNTFIGFAGAWIFYKYILPKAGSLDPDKLREAALSLDIPKGEGVLNWGVKFAGIGAKNMGQNLFASACINQWQDGKLRLVYPEVIATSKLR